MGSEGQQWGMVDGSSWGGGGGGMANFSVSYSLQLAHRPSKNFNFHLYPYIPANSTLPKKSQAVLLYICSNCVHKNMVGQ